MLLSIKGEKKFLLVIFFIVIQILLFGIVSGVYQDNRINENFPKEDLKSKKIPISADQTQFFDHGNSSGWEQELLELVNEVRMNPETAKQRNGYSYSCTTKVNSPLAMNKNLLNSSRGHSKAMAIHGKMQHDSFSDELPESYDLDPWTRIRDYYGFSGNSMAENVAAGYSSPKSVVKGWLGSSGHCANIFGDFSQMGYSLDYNSDVDYKYYHTQNFGGGGVYLLGVVYNDTNGDKFYSGGDNPFTSNNPDLGEGCEGIMITFDQGDYYTITAPGGGYAIPITVTGTVTVTFSGDNLDEPITRDIYLDLDGDNVKLDIQVNDPDSESGTSKENSEKSIPGFKNYNLFLMIAIFAQIWYIINKKDIK